MTADSKAEYVLGEILPDPAGMMLQTGFNRFVSPVGVHGLAKHAGNRLDLLAVMADKPGKGSFRKFINRAKEKYETIYIWDIWNPWLENVLERYEFKPATEFMKGVRLDGRRWDKK